MHFVNLSINNIRKIELIEMAIGEKGLVPIRGKNRQGKTTIIDSFHALLVGKAITNDMVTHGKKKGVIEGILQDGTDLYEVRRTVKPGGKNTIKIIKNGDSVVMSPQTFLDAIVNELTFNPRPFMNKSDEKKLQFMMDLLKIDFTEINKKLKKHTDERLITGRTIKKNGKLTHMDPCERVSVTELINKKNKLVAENQKAQETYDAAVRAEDDAMRQQQRDLESRNTLVDNFNEMSKRHEREKAEMEARHKQESDEIIAKQHAVNVSISHHRSRNEIQTVDLHDTSDLDTKLEAAGEVNERAGKYEMYLQKKSEIEALEAEYENYTRDINTLRKEKKEILASHEMPLDKLEIVIDDDVRPDGLYFNGIYSDEWSDSEGMSIALALCVKMKPKLNALFVDKGESFDADGIVMLKDFAIANGIQMIITIVDSEAPDEIPEGEIWIEEGGRLQ